MDKFSVIIPTYNYAHYIPHAINSVLTQHDPDYELIIIDDGSTDNTATLMEEYLQQHPKIIKYYYQKNSGVAAARNQGIQIATGDYLLVLDADDRLLPNTLQLFRVALQQYPQADMFCGGHIGIEANGKRRAHMFAHLLTQNKEKNFIGYLRKYFPVLNSGTLFNRRVFEKLRYPPEFRNGEDIVLFSHVLALFSCISLREPIVELYKHSDSLRHNLNYNRQVGLEIVDKIFDPAILPKEFLRYRKEYYAQRCLSLFRAFYLAKDYPVAKEYYKKALKVSSKILIKWNYLRKFLRSLFLT